MDKYIETIFLPLLYASIWCIIYFIVANNSTSFLVYIVPIAYGTGHFLSTKHNKHLALSNDPIALSLALVTAIIVTSIEIYLLNTLEATNEVIINQLRAFGYAYIGGHIFVFIAIALYSEFFQGGKNRLGMSLFVLMLLCTPVYGHLTGHIILAAIGFIFGFVLLLNDDGDSIKEILVCLGITTTLGYYAWSEEWLHISTIVNSFISDFKPKVFISLFYFTITVVLGFRAIRRF